jgi:hypothetical protein
MKITIFLPQKIVPKRSMNCAHLVAQFGHMELMITILRVLGKPGLQKFLMMTDRSAVVRTKNALASGCFQCALFDSFLLQSWLDVLALRCVP